MKLRKAGFEPVVLPLTETSRVPAPAAAVVLSDGFAAVAVTSANALRHAPPALLEGLVDLPCHVVGPRTARAARAAGFKRVMEGPGDALGLAGRIGASHAGGVLAYLCGRQRFPGFEERLAAQGVHVRPVETYETVAMAYSDEAVLAVLSGRPIEALSLYSAKAAEAARALTARPALRPLFEELHVYALSERIASAYGSTHSGQNIHVASAPTEDALFALFGRGG